MQRAETINITDVKNIVDMVYTKGEPKVSEDYSEFSKDIVYFSSSHELISYIDAELLKGIKLLSFAIYYPETKGFVEKQKIKLDTKKCSGHRYRFCIRGWGVIWFQLDYRKVPDVKCHFSVNTEKRANNWSDTYLELKSPSLWDWKLVEKHARRLIRELKKYAIPSV